ncbi:MAG: hypothetical protein KIT25_01740 [Enhydrobacter sp.]|nr:MAG: hypothetical protein KIT25_01740 [Enhydrobacter sp.]
MPLFFLIAIGAGAFTLGATTVDVLSEDKGNHAAQTVQSAPAQANAFTSMEECVKAATERGLPASSCKQS